MKCGEYNGLYPCLALTDDGRATVHHHWRSPALSIEKRPSGLSSGQAGLDLPKPPLFPTLNGKSASINFLLAA